MNCRELPNSLFCNEFADRWKEIDEIEEDHQKMIKIKETLKELPDEHNKNIAYLFKMLSKVADEHLYNKMSVKNLIVVVGPNLLWDKSGINIPLNSVYSLMIERYDWIFEDNVGNPLLSAFNGSVDSLFRNDIVMERGDCLTPTGSLEMNDDDVDSPLFTRRPNIRKKSIQQKKNNRLCSSEAIINELYEDETEEDFSEEHLERQMMILRSKSVSTTNRETYRQSDEDTISMTNSFLL